EPNGQIFSAVDAKTRYRDLGYAQAPDSIGPAVAQDVIRSFGHEGRIPPLPADLRIDYQMEQRLSHRTYFSLLTDPNINYNIGDPNSGVIRLRRVWDSWSTDYAFAPLRGIDLSSGPPYGPKPVYPS